MSESPALIGHQRNMHTNQLLHDLEALQKRRGTWMK